MVTRISNRSRMTARAIAGGSRYRLIETHSIVDFDVIGSLLVTTVRSRKTGRITALRRSQYGTRRMALVYVNGYAGSRFDDANAFRSSRI